MGTWRLTQETISLENASTLARAPPLDNKVIEITYLYSGALIEYDWTYRRDKPKAMANKTVNNTEYTEHIKSSASILASGIWSRIVTTIWPQTGPNQYKGLL